MLQQLVGVGLVGRLAYVSCVCMCLDLLCLDLCCSFAYPWALGGVEENVGAGMASKLVIAGWKKPGGGQGLA